MDKYDVAEQAYKNGYEDGKPKWIPVTERLPEKSDYYLAYHGSGYIGILPYSVQYKLFNAFDGNGTKYAMDVAHWMPLPEPPKGE